MKRVTFTSESSSSCQLIYGEKLLERVPESLKILDSGARKALQIHPEDEYLMPGGEHIKSIDRVLEVYQVLRASGRRAVTVIGGGSLIDLVGYAASTHGEVDRLFLYPTTTVSQIMPPLSGFSINFEFIKNLLKSCGLPDRVYVDTDLTYDTMYRIHRGEIFFPLLVAYSLDERLFKYVLNHIISGDEVTRELWGDIIYSASSIFVKSIGSSRTVVGCWVGDLIQSASWLRTEYSTAQIYGAILELHIARTSGLMDGSGKDDLYEALRVLGKLDRSMKIDVSSLVDLVNQKGGVKIALPASSGESSHWITARDFETLVRDRPWMEFGSVL